MGYENRCGKPKGIPLHIYNDSWLELESVLRRRIKDHGFSREPTYLPRYSFVLEPELYPSEYLFPAGKETVALFTEVQSIIHPDINFEEMLQAAQNKNPDTAFSPDWKSAYNDIHICVNHISSKADFLLSNDEDIYGKAKELERCGTRRILSFSTNDQKILREAIERVTKFPKNKGR